jgi:uncharacterized membrane protein HdeD (DUF308 family)
VTVDRRTASARLHDWFKREAHTTDDEADRRADEVVTLLGGGGLLALAPIEALTSNWWIFLVRGLLALVFGVLALVEPVAALTALVIVFGVWAFIDGISALALAVTGWRSWQLAFAGIVGIGVGLLTFFRPGITAIGLYAAVSAWAIARGILEIVVAVEMRKRVGGEGWLVAAGVSSLLFGVLMIVLPVAGVLALAWLIGIYALAFGIMMLVLSLRLRQLRRPSRREPRMITPTIQPA